MTTTRRIKRKLKEHKNKLFVALGLIVIITLLVFFLTTTKVTPPKKNIQMYEVTQTDLFNGLNLTSNQLTFKGVALGDTQKTVLDKLGYPDAQNAYAPDITNMEFGKNMGLNETGVLLQFKGDNLVKITFRKNANDFLIGSTKIKYDNESLVLKFGAPDSIKHIPLAPNSPIPLRIYTYKEGYEFVTKSGQQIAFSILETSKPIES